MEPWWFLEPLLYTCMVIAAIGALVAWIWDKITDGESMAPAAIATISAIPLFIWVLLASIWLILWMFYTIWSPFLT